MTEWKKCTYSAKDRRMQQMAKKDLFTIHGAKELAKELKEMSQGFQNKMVRPGLTVAVAEVRKEAKKQVKSGTLKKKIKSKVFSKGRGKGIVGRAGILDGEQVPNGKKTVAIAKYAGVQNYGSAKRNIKAKHFLESSLETAEPEATKKLILRTQEKVTAFHKSKGDPGKSKR